MPSMQSFIPALLVGLRLSVPVFAQQQQQQPQISSQSQQVQFNQVINLNGDVSLLKALICG